jgi:transcriptional regulator with XRE-family HTH domain
MTGADDVTEGEQKTLATPRVLKKDSPDKQSVEQGRTHVRSPTRHIPTRHVYAAGYATGGGKTDMRAEYKPFADALRATMTRQGLNASEVARRIWGTTKDKRGYDVARNRDRIGAYLAGTSYPEPENLEKLAAALNIPVEELAIERENPGPAKPRPPASDLQVNQIPGEPGKMHLRVDRPLSWRLVMQIVKMIKDEEMAELDRQLAEQEQLGEIVGGSDIENAANNAGTS